MKRAFAFLLSTGVLSTSVVALAPRAHAQVAPIPAGGAPANTEAVPSAFAYGFRGFVVGAGLGVAAGYLFARQDDFESGDWKPLTYGAGIGALAGGIFGLSLGLSDIARERQGTGYFVLRDMIYGAGFGATAGAIAGGLVAIGTKDAEHILFGASIGALTGSALGIVLGLVESGRQAPVAQSGFGLAVVPTQTATGDLAWGPAISGRY